MAKATRAQPKNTAAADDGRTEYKVTERAPSRVAGRRVAKGDTLRLTADEARGELLALHIKPAGLTEALLDAVKTSVVGH